MFTHSLPLLSLYKQVFSLLPQCAVCSNRHLCGQHVLGHLLFRPSQSPTWPTNTLTLSRLSEKFPPENNSRMKPLFIYQKTIFQQCRKVAVVTKGSGVYTAYHLFQVDKQEGGDNSSQAHVTSRGLSPWDWPRALARHECTTKGTRARMLTPEQASIFNGTDGVQARCHDFFPDSSDQ